MKIKTKKATYEQVMAIPKKEHKKPKKQWAVFRNIVKWAAFVDLLRVRFQYNEIGMEKLGKEEPCLILMNHSSFVDLEIVARIFGDRPYQIVATLDGFVGKNWLMRTMGCIPTRKFITDTTLVKDMVHVTRKYKSSIVMFPEASYSFDGTTTTLPESLGKCLKLLNVPVVMVRTYGAFSRDPLYNCLQKRRVKVTADVEYILSSEDIKSKSAGELNDILNANFELDYFRWQQDNKIRIKEKFRADGLNRVLYKCPHCQAEGEMVGKGIHLVCKNCHVKYELTEYGYLKALNKETKFDHVPDWYQWERECVREELLNGSYLLDTDVDICAMVDSKCVYRIGEGHLTHTKEGFHLTGCDGKLDYRQKPEASYSLYSDYYWYEIGDVISIGDVKIQYYCFPKSKQDVVAKTRLAAEELFKLVKTKK